MCVAQTLDSEAAFGELYELCADYQDCLSQTLEMDLEPGPASVLFKAYAADVAVVEFDYFDLDHRSEFSETHETSFSAGLPEVSRVHFFRSPHLGKPIPLRDFVESSKDSYLGYAIIRPQEPPSVGRSVVPPSGRCDGLAASQLLVDHVRTAVAEHVELFGVPLRAVGVPFMEQDGHLLRCAHVTAWMTHYTAVLRGVVPRRPSAHFNSAEDPQRAYGRSYPSDGLSSWSQSKILQQLDLPPEIIECAALLDPRELSWYDRSELEEGLLSMPRPADDVIDRIWLAENITATICRYLNSGIPCILNREDHSQVVCGYVREEDVAKNFPVHRTGGQTDVVGLIVHDDQVGPYQVVPVDDILDQVLGGTDTVSVLVPLPRGLWLSGKSAEIAGSTVFATVVQERSRTFGERPASKRPRGEEGRRLRELLAELCDITESGRRGRLAVRSYAITGSDFKQDFARRIDDPEAAKVVGYTPLPKYVWVVEVLDRDLRKLNQPAVLGTVVLDGSAVSDGVHRPPSPLVVHIPGQISRIQFDAFDEDYWVSTHTHSYHTGRWNHKHSGVLDAARVASRSKTASIGGRG